MHVAQKWSRFWGNDMHQSKVMHVAQKWSRFWDHDMHLTKD
jgi:hypothetical protein